MLIERLGPEGLVGRTPKQLLRMIWSGISADISTHITLYPSLTESGRYRLKSDFKYRQELVTDIFVSLSGWYSFDNKAPIGIDATVRQDDYGLVTSLGWDF